MEKVHDLTEKWMILDIVGDKNMLAHETLTKDEKEKLYWILSIPDKAKIPSPKFGVDYIMMLWLLSVHKWLMTKKKVHWFHLVQLVGKTERFLFSLKIKIMQVLYKKLTQCVLTE